MAKVNPQILVDLAPKFEAWGRLTVELFGTLREQAGLPPEEGIPDDQAWFWTPEWQAMEREADDAETKGDYLDFDGVGEAIKYLNSL